MTLRRVFYLIHTDMLRYAETNRFRLTFLKKVSLLLLPCIQAIAIHRFSHYAWTRRWFLLARFFWNLNILFFSLDIAPFTEIGPFLYMPHPTSGMVLVGKIGPRVSLLGACGIGGGMGNEMDIGGGNGCPVLEDGVSFGYGAVVLGPVRIGAGAVVAPMTFVNKSIPPGALAAGNPCRIVHRNQPHSTARQEESEG